MTFGGNNNKMEYPKKIGMSFVNMKKIAKVKKSPHKIHGFEFHYFQCRRRTTKQKYGRLWKKTLKVVRDRINEDTYDKIRRKKYIK